MSLPKPLMRGLLARRLKIQLTFAFTVSIMSALGIKYLIGEPRKKAYAEFYKHYDDAQDFIAMREAGIFDSVKPIGK